VFFAYAAVPSRWAFGISLAITILLTFGTKESSRFNIVVTLLHVVLVVFIIIAGLVKSKPANAQPFFPFEVRCDGLLLAVWQGCYWQGCTSGASLQFAVLLAVLCLQLLVETSTMCDLLQIRGVFNGAALVFFSYIGFDSVACSAEEVNGSSSSSSF
jgi:APA family basic amino acid/polyamine antiporter